MRWLSARKQRLTWIVPADTPPTPTITSVNPTTGSAAGGDTLTIRGTGFQYPPTSLHAYDVFRVLFYAAGFTPVEGVNLNVTSPTKLTVVTPALPGSGTITIAILAPGGRATLPSLETISLPNPPPPFVASLSVSTISPNFGDPAGGDFVTLTGIGFTGATGATIGGVALTSFSVLSDTSAIGVTGAHAASITPVDVTVSTASSTGTLVGGFTYAYESLVWSQTV